VDSIYEVPLSLGRRRPRSILLERLHLPQTEAKMEAWEGLVERIRQPKDEITIHFVGKYVEYEDSYKSINEALYHGGFQHQLKVDLQFVEAEALEQPGGEQLLNGSVGILVAPGFGDRGSRGMMAAAEYARTNNACPYFGICYGFQWAVVEFARNVAGLVDADSTEVNGRHAAQGHLQTARPARRRRPRRHDAPRQLRLPAGARLVRIQAVRRRDDHERHRHRYEFNCLYEKTLTDQGLRIVGRSTDGKFVEIVELPDHPWYHRRAVPPRVQVEAAAPASTVRRLCRGRAPLQGPTGWRAVEAK
jgi:CTP synthase